MKTVIEDVGVWLPRTKTWLFNEIAALDESWSPWVIANRSENLDEFPCPQLYSLRDHHSKLRWTIEMVMARSGLFAHAPSITRFCKTLGADLLHSHFGTTGWSNLKLAKLLDIPHIVTFYGFDVTRIPRMQRWRNRYKIMFNQITQVLCEGPHMAEQIVKLGCHPDRVAVHRLGVRLEDLPFQARQKSEPTKFLMAGSFREKKGLTDGLMALAKLSKKRPDLAWQLTIVGGPGIHKEGEQIAAELDTIARRYAIESRVEYTGFLSHPELINIATKHDIFLCPSVSAADGDTEGGAPVVMIEMAALGLPVIGTNHCDMPYVLAEQNRSLLVPERDVEALTRSIEKLLDSSETWPILGRENRMHCESRFNYNTQGAMLSHIYDRAIS